MTRNPSNIYFEILESLICKPNKNRVKMKPRQLIPKINKLKTRNKMTAKELEPKGIFELREMIRRTAGNNPRNLSGGLVTGMDREECIAYMTNGTLPNPERTAGRKASLAAGAYKFFAKGGDPTGEITAPEASEQEEAQEIKAAMAEAKAEKKAPAPTPAAAPAPGLDALMTALSAAVKADVLASLPPPPKQETICETRQ